MTAQPAPPLSTKCRRNVLSAAKANPGSGFKIISDNRAAGHNYELKERFEAGRFLESGLIEKALVFELLAEGGPMAHRLA